MREGAAFYRRQFLNTEEHGGMAAIEASVDNPAGGARGSFNAEFAVSDCNRTVALSFSVYSDEDATNARQKVTRLRRALCAFERELLAQIDQRERGA